MAEPAIPLLANGKERKNVTEQPEELSMLQGCSALLALSSVEAAAAQVHRLKQTQRKSMMGVTPEVHQLLCRYYCIRHDSMGIWLIAHGILDSYNLYETEVSSK